MITLFNIIIGWFTNKKDKPAHEANNYRREKQPNYEDLLK